MAGFQALGGGWFSAPADIPGSLLTRAPVRALWGFIEGACRKLTTIEVTWRQLPITLYPVLWLFAGWQSPVAWGCVVLIFVCNWRTIFGVGAWISRHWLDALLATGGITLLVWLLVWICGIYTNFSREVPAPHLPAGFYIGQYNPAWLSNKPVPYGVYVPPDTMQAKGPFALIVYLHGFGERTKDLIFASGLPRSIATCFGDQASNGRFGFVAFFPLDPTGEWNADTDEVEAAMRALDYVIHRHNIDPRRVYLTGPSSGGDGVWRLAEAYPGKWAAVAPVSSFIDPDVDKVRHIPAWIFHSAKDVHSPVARERALVRRLQAAGADVRYTEIPNAGHVISNQVYNPKQLYDWFEGKIRE